MKHLVMVYGTLKRGKHNHRLLETSEYVGSCRTCGMLYVAGLPFFKKEGLGSVYGELYRVDDDTLRSLDRLEGHNEQNPERSFYRRIVTDVYYEDTTEKAYVYEINSPMDNQYRVESGIF